MRLAVALAFAVLAAAGSASSGRQVVTGDRQVQPVPLAVLRAFDYDRAAPLDLREVSAEDRGGVTVRNMSQSRMRASSDAVSTLRPSG